MLTMGRISDIMMMLSYKEKATLTSMLVQGIEDMNNVSGARDYESIVEFDDIIRYDIWA